MEAVKLFNTLFKLSIIFVCIKTTYGFFYQSIFGKRPNFKSANLYFLNGDNLNIKEEAVVLFLNRSNGVLGGYKVSSGGITGTIVDIRIILAIALKCLSSAIILAHTHPSGELNPSRTDKELTQKLKEAAK